MKTTQSALMKIAPFVRLVNKTRRQGKQGLLKYLINIKQFMMYVRCTLQLYFKFK